MSVHMYVMYIHTYVFTYVRMYSVCMYSTVCLYEHMLHVYVCTYSTYMYICMCVCKCGNSKHVEYHCCEILLDVTYL